MRAPSFSIAAAVCLAAAPAVAQNRPVVFLHGLLGNGSTWSAGSQALHQQLQFPQLLPLTLGWQDSYETQANTLENYLAAFVGTNAVAVSQSNGGIVARQYGRTRGSGSRITGHVAVGSLHQGALLATNVRNGSVESYAVELAASVLVPVVYFTVHDSWFGDLWRQGDYLPFIFLGTFLGIAEAYTQGIGALGYPVPTLGNPPVLDEMGPGTSFMSGPSGLNSAGSLAAEASAFQQRISISTAIPSTDVQSRIWCHQYCNIGVRVEVAATAAALYEHYSESDPEGAFLWWPLTWEALDFDRRWHAFIGSFVGFENGTPIYSSQDGILPISTSQYVYGTEAHIQLPGNISHLEQPTNPTVIQALGVVLRDRFAIPAQAPPPPPPPPSLGVDLSGPTMMGPNDQCWWSATAHDGTPPYTYDWMNGGFVETTDGSSSLGSGGPVWITVWVSDAAGGEAYADMQADVDENTYGCH